MTKVTITIDKSNYIKPKFKVGEIFYRHNLGLFICLKIKDGNCTMQPLKDNKVLRFIQIFIIRLKIKLRFGF